MLELLKKGSLGSATGIDSSQFGDRGTAALVKNVSGTIGVIDGCKKKLKTMMKRKKEHGRKIGSPVDAACKNPLQRTLKSNAG